MSCALVKLLFYVDAKHLKKIALKRIHLNVYSYVNALDLTIIVNCFVWLFGLGGLCKKFLSQWLTQAFLNWNSKSIETETEINTESHEEGIDNHILKVPSWKLIDYNTQLTVRSATFLSQSSVNFLIFQVMFFWSPSSKQQERILHTGLIRKQKM